MGETGQARGLSDAPGGRAARGLAARPALSRFWRDEAGATAVELGIIVALITVVLIASIGFLSDGLNVSFTKTGNALDTAG